MQQTRLEWFYPFLVITITRPRWRMERISRGRTVICVPKRVFIDEMPHGKSIKCLPFCLHSIWPICFGHHIAVNLFLFDQSQYVLSLHSASPSQDSSARVFPVIQKFVSSFSFRHKIFKLPPKKEVNLLLIR